MSKQDGNSSYEGILNEQEYREQISHLFSRVLGCNNREESILRQAKQIVHPHVEVGDKLCGIHVRHFFHNSKVVTKFREMQQQERAGARNVDAHIPSEFETAGYEENELYLLDKLLVCVAHMDVDFSENKEIFTRHSLSTSLSGLHTLADDMDTVDLAFENEVAQSNRDEHDPDSGQHSHLSVNALRVAMKLDLALYDHKLITMGEGMHTEVDVIEIHGDRARSEDDPSRMSRERVYIAASDPRDHDALLNALHMHTAIDPDAFEHFDAVQIAVDPSKAGRDSEVTMAMSPSSTVERNTLTLPSMGNTVQA